MWTDQHYTPLCAAFASVELELKPPFQNPGSTTASYDNYTPLKRKVYIISFGTHNDQKPKGESNRIMFVCLPSGCVQVLMKRKLW